MIFVGFSLSFTLFCEQILILAPTLIKNDVLQLSLCDRAMIEISNPGASGSIFYLTEDDEFILKTVMYREAEFLQKLLAGYYMNLNQNPRTLLPKFFGQYCYQVRTESEMFDIVVASVRCQLMKIYDDSGE